MSANAVPRTDAELRLAAVDVAFEFKMFLQAWRRLDVSPQSLGHNNSAVELPLAISFNASGTSIATTRGGPTSSFHNIEGVLVHFRNLIEFFFTGKAERRGLVLAHHYTGDAPRKIPAWAKEYEQRCNELLSHLTYRRSSHYRQNNEHHWPDITEKCHLMDRTIADFLNSLPPEKRAWFIGSDRSD
jgi:hypothetical protein